MDKKKNLKPLIMHKNILITSYIIYDVLHMSIWIRGGTISMLIKELHYVNCRLEYPYCITTTSQSMLAFILVPKSKHEYMARMTG
jgi:hypothetical protein